MHNHAMISSQPQRPDVEIVIPTLASVERRLQLLRAIESVFEAAQYASVRVIVCVNGSHYDERTVSELRHEPRVSVHQFNFASAPRASAEGRRRVTARHFGFLDDDDVLLPGAIDLRLDTLRKAPSDVDVVISNGIRRIGGMDRPMLDDLASAVSNPLRALIHQNWLPSCGALFRTERIGQAYFDAYHDFAEWTWIAYQLAIDGRRLVACDAPTFIVYDTPRSLSKSQIYRDSYIQLFQRMLNRKPPADVRQLIQRRLAAALHDASTDRLKAGELQAALRFHLRSLFHLGGWRYLSYSRHILSAYFNH